MGIIRNFVYAVIQGIEGAEVLVHDQGAAAPSFDCGQQSLVFYVKLANGPEEVDRLGSFG